MAHEHIFRVFQGVLLLLPMLLWCVCETEGKREGERLMPVNTHSLFHVKFTSFAFGVAICRSNGRKSFFNKKKLFITKYIYIFCVCAEHIEYIVPYHL